MALCSELCSTLSIKSCQTRAALVRERATPLRLAVCVHTTKLATEPGQKGSQHMRLASNLLQCTAVMGAAHLTVSKVVRLMPCVRA